MNIFYDISEVKKDAKTVVTVGTFDGFHLGHQKIINELIFRSVDAASRNFIVTFEPHPRLVIGIVHDVQILTTLDEKFKYLQAHSVQNVLVLKFTKEFSQLNFRDFIVKYLVDGIGMSEIVIGYDHQFGKNREGNAKALNEIGKEYNFKVTQVSPFSIEETSVSSTKIRRALQDGNIQLANSFLGKQYEFSGKVVRGIKRGTEIGFPTANIGLMNRSKITPKRGVYFVEVVTCGKKYFGMMNIGYRPTFNSASEMTLEVHIFYFNEDIYDEEINIKFIDRIREEKKFSSVRELVEQLSADRQLCFERVNNYKVESF
ncbi:MAG: bifunctional riboflavin kinase/FAD synthetase [Ignavibacteria bacterium]|nr:bifunctional riboflavin kinase/FAD synthetase [Ignavibacteria bacterium]